QAVHLPGIYVHRVLPLTPEQAAEKRIEKRTVQGKPEPTTTGANNTETATTEATERGPR
ncbi:MAG: 3-oxoacid CoA-transferase subunit, partial [Actinomycetota bacterium]|nr:3-oxoacid CoA-transferase subunit [Actinomycetota bacterium]